MPSLGRPPVGGWSPPFLPYNRKAAAARFLLRWVSPSFARRLSWDAMERPQYGYGTYRAALQARALGLDRIAVVEMGVAGGDGLVVLEEIAGEVSSATAVGIEVYGFDRGEGLPEPVDYRDLPYLWREGFFRLDEEALRARLTTAQLVLGDVEDTVAVFCARDDVAPIGFVAFDLDFYSATAAALALFNGHPDRVLPRVFCYFDDIIGDDWELHSDHTGQLLAINEFNSAYDELKIARINGLHHKRRLPAPWNEMMFVMHSFRHPLYNRHVYPQVDWQRPLSR